MILFIWHSEKCKTIKTETKSVIAKDGEWPERLAAKGQKGIFCDDGNMFSQLYLSKPVNYILKKKKRSNFTACKLCLNNPDLREKRHPPSLLTRARALLPVQSDYSRPYKCYPATQSFLACQSVYLQTRLTLLEDSGQSLLPFCFPAGNSALANSAGACFDPEEWLQFGWTLRLWIASPLARWGPVPTCSLSLSVRLVEPHHLLLSRNESC